MCITIIIVITIVVVAVAEGVLVVVVVATAAAAIILFPIHKVTWQLWNIRITCKTSCVRRCHGVSVACLLNVPATRWRTLGTDLLQQLYVLPGPCLKHLLPKLQQQLLFALWPLLH